MNGQPKTERSRRSIALSADTVALLHEIRGKQITQQLEVVDAWTDSGYVFTDASGMPVDPNLATRAFKKVVATAGLPKLTIHGLRHTHATILLEQGVNPKVVSERLGHCHWGVRGRDAVLTEHDRFSSQSGAKCGATHHYQPQKKSLRQLKMVV